MGSPTSARSWRNLIAFWVFGICSNFGYVLMLTGAKDMVSKGNAKNSHKLTSIQNTSSLSSSNNPQCLESSSDFECQPISTGAVLLCNIVPATVVQLLFPFFIHYIPYGARIAIICLTQVASLLIASFATQISVALIAVCIGSLSFGLGETTFLALSSKYHKDTISLYSSGCGAAGIIGSLVYAVATTTFGVSPETVLLAMTAVPLALILNFLFVLERVSPIRALPQEVIKEISHTSDSDNRLEKPIITVEKGSVDKRSTIMTVLPYAATVGSTYFLCYFITQGMTTFLVFDCLRGFRLAPNAQFRWYQVLYNAGTFIAKSSGPLFSVPQIALFSIPFIQMVVFTVLTLTATTVIALPHFALALGFVGFLGLTNGIAYINSFKMVHKKTQPEQREFALTLTSPASFMGILVAGLMALPAHEQICKTFH